jgi:hypothetical protein
VTKLWASRMESQSLLGELLGERDGRQVVQQGFWFGRIEPYIVGCITTRRLPRLLRRDESFDVSRSTAVVVP